MSRFYLCIIFSCLVCFSIQQNIRLTQSSKNPSEGEILTLRCVTASDYDLLQWSLNDKIVVESTTTNNILAPGKSPDQYVASVSTNKYGNHVFRLKINPVTKNDTGRWQCIVSSSPGIPASTKQSVERTTKQSVDKDDIVNTVEPGSRDDTLKSRAVVTPTKGPIFTFKDGKTKFLAYNFKELESAPSETSSPKSAVLQEMATKQSVGKDDNVKTVEPGQHNVIKVNTKPESRYVVTPTTVTEEEFIFTFMDETSKFSHEFEELESKSTMSSSKSTIRPLLEEMTTKPTFDKNDEKTVKPWPRVYITVTTNPESLDVTPTTEPIFTLMDWTTESYYEFEKIKAFEKIRSNFTKFPFIIPIICTAFVLGMVCTCILCKIKKRVLCL